MLLYLFQSDLGRKYNLYLHLQFPLVLNLAFLSIIVHGHAPSEIRVLLCVQTLCHKICNHLIGRSVLKPFQTMEKLLKNEVQFYINVLRALLEIIILSNFNGTLIICTNLNLYRFCRFQSTLFHRCAEPNCFSGLIIH